MRLKSNSLYLSQRKHDYRFEFPLSRVVDQDMDLQRD